jgi:hypothetical protein
MNCGRTSNEAKAMAGEATRVAPVLRVLKFVAGFVSGLLLVPMGLAIVLLIIVLQRAPTDTRPPAVLESAGKDISSAGGATLDVDSGGASQLHQVCRDGCDDIRLSDKQHDVSAIRVLRSDGTCVACRKVGLYEASSRRWTVRGERLAIVNGSAP